MRISTFRPSIRCSTPAQYRRTRIDQEYGPARTATSTGRDRCPDPRLLSGSSDPTDRCTRVIPCSVTDRPRADVMAIEVFPAPCTCQQSPGTPQESPASDSRTRLAPSVVVNSRPQPTGRFSSSPILAISVQPAHAPWPRASAYLHLDIGLKPHQELNRDLWLQHRALERNRRPTTH